MNKIYLTIAILLLFSSTLLFAQIIDPTPTTPCDDLWEGIIELTGQINVGITGEAIQSSTKLNRASSLAVDGDNFGNSTQTQLEMDPWWEIKFDQKTILNEMQLWYDISLFPNGVENTYILFSDFPFLADDLNSALSSPLIQHIYYT